MTLSGAIKTNIFPKEAFGNRQWVGFGGGGGGLFQLPSNTYLASKALI